MEGAHANLRATLQAALVVYELTRRRKLCNQAHRRRFIFIVVGRSVGRLLGEPRWPSTLANVFSSDQ